MEYLGLSSVVSITVICFLIGMFVRNVTPIDNKWIPCIVGTAGLALGVLGWFIMPDYPANDILTAMAVGIVSGLASTGIDQMYHQLNPRNDQEGGNDI